MTRFIEKSAKLTALDDNARKGNFGQRIDSLRSRSDNMGIMADRATDDKMFAEDKARKKAESYAAKKLVPVKGIDNSNVIRKIGNKAVMDLKNSPESKDRDKAIMRGYRAHKADRRYKKLDDAETLKK